MKPKKRRIYGTIRNKKHRPRSLIIARSPPQTLSLPPLISGSHPHLSRTLTITPSLILSLAANARFPAGSLALLSGARKLAPSLSTSHASLLCSTPGRPVTPLVSSPPRVHHPPVGACTKHECKSSKRAPCTPSRPTKNLKLLKD